MPENQIEYTNLPAYPQNEVFGSQEEMQRSLSRLCYGDLYIIGRLWINLVKAGLLGQKCSLIPGVQAATPPPPPEKPPLMRYKDLPVYKSPHYEYKDHEADKDRCPKANVKLVHKMIYPYVRCFRRSIAQTCCEVSCELKSCKKEFYSHLNIKKNNFKSYMRDPENLIVRQAFVAFGGATGYYIASAKGLPSKVLCTGFGLLVTGALCFPQETDEAFRTFTYHTGKTAIALYNYYCRKMYAMRERLPCPDNLPPPQPMRKSNVCPAK